MVQQHSGERWKTIQFDIECTNEGRIEISSQGRIRTFNKISDGNIINGSMINGYRILRLKLFKPRVTNTQKEIDYLKNQILKVTAKLKSLNEKNENAAAITQNEDLLETLKKRLSKKYQTDTKERTINYHCLVHRLVAAYFLPKPTSMQTIVAHLDFDKLNNRASNLKWMTPAQNYEHQQNSPYVIKEKQERLVRPKENSRSTKLSVTKVMLMKKLINQGKTAKQLSKQFRVTETQIFRIKKGENWADIDAAK